jgi:hypothetical protein
MMSRIVIGITGPEQAFLLIRFGSQEWRQHSVDTQESIVFKVRPIPSTGFRKDSVLDISEK